MVKSKKFVAVFMASVMGMTTVGLPCHLIKAETKEMKKNSEAMEESVQEYVVMAKNEEGYEKAEEVCEDSLIQESKESEQLLDNNIVVAEFTEAEARNLERDKNIALVEEDILFEGSGFEGASLNEEFGTDFAPEEQAKMKAFLKELRGETEAVSAEDQWNIDAIHANDQEYKEVQEQVKVAIIDTGVTLTEDIAIAGRVNLIEGEEDVSPLYEDVSGHGTAVASVIAAKENDIGITGVNPDVKLYSVKALDDEKRATLSRIIEGIYWCIDNDIDIINMSFGTSQRSDILQKVVKEAEEAGILMIAAAGNLGEEAGESTVEYPAAFAEVIAVGASCPQGTVSEISSVGEEIELMAPGEDVPATGYLDEVIKTEGTSMAAPHVTGAASALWAKDRTKSARFIRELLKASAVSIGEEEKTGSGIVDLEYALSIYDAFAESYAEEEPEQTAKLEELKNPSEPESYEEEVVEASWGTSRHEDAVAQYDKENASALKYIRRGAKLPDQLSYMKSLEGENGRETFHGHKNYVADYLYMMNLARICYKKGFDTALANASFSASDSYSIEGKTQMKTILKKLKQDFGNDNANVKVLTSDENSKENQARILVGIATHIVMDTYAHKARECAGGAYVQIEKDQKDNEARVPSRWTSAKNAAYDVLDTWHYDWEPGAEEYMQNSHNANKFKLYRLYTYVINSDSSAYAHYGTWFKEHSCED